MTTLHHDIVLDDVILTEGDEDVQYILLELPADTANKLAPGAQFHLQDLTTEAPKLQFVDGTMLQGVLEDSVGSVVLFHKNEHAQGVPAPGLQYSCHTEKVISFTQSGQTS